MDDINVGDEYERDGTSYQIVHTDQTVKDADAANWQPAIGYQSNDDDSPVRVRSRLDFLAKFTRVEA